MSMNGEKDRHRTIARATVLSMLLILSISLVLHNANATDEDNGQSDGGIYQQKEVPPKIEGLRNPAVVHPGVPAEFKAMVKCSTPEKVVLWIDSENPWINFTCNPLRSEFFASEPAKDWVSLDKVNSSVDLNSSTRNYDIKFSLVFTWMMEGNRPYEISYEAMDPFGLKDHVSVKEAYFVEKDLVIDGDAKLLLEDGTKLSNGDYCKGGSFVRLEGVSIHFEGSPLISPSPENIKMGMRDSTGRVWEYRPRMTEQVNKVSFSFPLPRSDGPTRIEFVIFTLPIGATCLGEAAFDLIMDSTSPILGDPWYSFSEGNVHFSWAYTEKGSGIKVSTLKYSLEDSEGGLINDLRAPLDVALIEARLVLTFEAPEDEDLRITLELTDNVENPLQGEQSFLFTTRIKPFHDMAIDSTLLTNPEIMIEGQLLSVRARVENLGSTDERDVVFEVRIDGLHYTTIEMGTIPAGSIRDHWWTWTIAGEKTQIDVEVDPEGTVQDEDRSNNLMSFVLWPEYLDIYADPGYLAISNREPDPYEIIDLTFKVNCLGTISTGDFKALFLQDEKFMGLFEMGSMRPDQYVYLKTAWKVDPQAKNLTLVIDPYNEVLESAEYNNRIDIENPFYAPPRDDVESDPKTIPDKNEDPIVNEGPEGEKKEGPSGGTTWEGPVDDTPPGGNGQVIVGPGPYDPEVPTGPLLPPYILPSLALTFSFSLFGAMVFVLRFEPARYKLALVLFPLYSKLKKNKVEVGTRFEILGYLKAKPGANYSELKEILDLNDGSLVHHLRVLEREEKIYSKKMGKFKLFYVASYRRQSTIQSYISPLHKRILEIISQNPGIVPKRLSIILDRSQTDISYHLSELSRIGFLDRKKKGRNIHYFINKDLSGLV
ncbi:MAG: hypothetical protein MUC62_01100 [Candidatus Thermoplasmatota archaeon]|jgi:predicted transcriptional regulator|nr:hypothetical protein [Candidatus Thermoplasmatota archaeon]